MVKNAMQKLEVVNKAAATTVSSSTSSRVPRRRNTAGKSESNHRSTADHAAVPRMGVARGPSRPSFSSNQGTEPDSMPP